MAIRFAIWDLHLYLDTHPDDQKAKELLDKYYDKYSEVKKEFVRQYGPLEPGRYGNGNAWLKAPWPWVNGGDC